MKLKEVMSELAAKGSEATKRLWVKHGAKEPFFGVKIADLKVIAQKLKGEQALALELYATGNGDAQYLAGIMVDGAKMTRAQVQSWADHAAWRMISSAIVPVAASEHPDGFALARTWIDSPQEHVAIAGWASLGALATVIPDERLPVKELGTLLDRVARILPAAPDRVRQAMNHFIIACGTYVAPLGDKAIATARKVGQVEVDVGDTECKIPAAEVYIMKSRRGAPIAPKRKTVRC
jgi:3-methyladenine DNA glycosylase AlkD